MRRKARVILAAALSLFALSRPAAAYDTIDCDRDTKPAERTICSRQDLQILDAKITEAYVAVMEDSRFRARVKRGLLRSQRAFLDQRNRCGADASCIEEVMSMRLSRMANYQSS